MAIEFVRTHLELKEFGFESVVGDFILVDGDKLEEVKKKINKLKGSGKVVIVSGRDASFNRGLLEHGGFQVLMSPEKFCLRDGLYERDSGLNHILCKIAKENGVAIGINLGEIVCLEGKEKANRISRVMQNIMLCKKYKVDMIISMMPESLEDARNVLDLRAVGEALGMDTLMAKRAVEKSGISK